MKKKSFVVLAALFILGTAVFGGGESGNGGRAVAIKHFRKMIAVVLTDLWDAEQPRFSSEQDENNRVPYHLMNPAGYSTWERLYSDRKNAFLEKVRKGGEAGRKFAELFLRSERELFSYQRRPLDQCPPRHDVRRRTLRPRLDWFQAIYTHLPTKDDPSKYMCISTLFRDKATPINRAAAEFHEVAYLGAVIELKHTTSDATQQLVSIAFERNFKNLNPVQIENILAHYMNGETFPVINEPLNTLIGSNSGLTDELLTKVLYSPSIGRPWEIPEALKLPIADFVVPYATKDSGGDEELKILEPEDYTCDYKFTLRQEIFSRIGLGHEVQVYVLPPGKRGYNYGPGNRWFEETGPSPYASFTYENPVDPFVQKEIPQFVLLKRDQKIILWSFGGLIGTCTKTR